MKKFSSILVALVMLFALCIPAFAGANVDALEEGPAKEIATVLIAAKETEQMDLAKMPAQDVGNYVAAHVKDINAYADATTRDAAVDAAFKALQADNYNRTWGFKVADWKALPAAVKTALQEAVERPTLPTNPTNPTNPGNPDDPTNPGNTDPDLGISTFDPSGALDNVVDGISDNDLSGLFGTLRNTINDLSGRLSDVFRGGNNGGNSGGSNNGGDNAGDNTFGGSEPTGDTAIYAVAGVAAVAAAALIFTKKKSESK